MFHPYIGVYALISRNAERVPYKLIGLTLVPRAPEFQTETTADSGQIDHLGVFAGHSP
jgi:hypothetical protein